MLKDRIAPFVGLAALVAAAFAADYYWCRDSLCLHVLVLAGSFFCYREFWPLCRARGEQTFSNWGTLCGCVLVMLHYWMLRSAGSDAPELHREARGLLEGGLAVAVLGAFLLTARRRQYPLSIGGLGVTCLAWLYIWFLPSFVLKLRHLGTDGELGGQDWRNFGSGVALATIAVAKGCDVCAYLFGRWLGRRKLFPALSPGKTLEGMAAGLLGSLLLAAVLRLPWVNVLPAAQFGWGATAAFGLLVGFSGMMGDLSESLLKRSAGVKDSGETLPGYGGVLDVVDSLMVAGPVAYFLVRAILAWG